MQKKTEKPGAGGTEHDATGDSRRDFVTVTVGAAIAAGAVLPGRAALAHRAGVKGVKQDRFAFSARIAPEALTPDNIGRISDIVARALAADADAALRAGATALDMTVTGLHSRDNTFSKVVPTDPRHTKTAVRE